MSDTGKFVCVCKKEAIAITDDNQELPISNLGAIRMGLEALNKEDANDFARSKQLWTQADQLLNNESQDDEGPAAAGVVHVADDFFMAGVGGTDCGYWP